MALKTEPFIMNFGPQHPSTHGVFRMRVTLDGEEVVDLEPVMGYLHRGIEKLSEERTYVQIIPFTDRLDYMAGMSNNLAYVLAVEKLADIKVPERAEYIRVIMCELQRIASHLVAIGTFINDLGASSTPLLYMFREREKILDMFEMVCGQRMTVNYMRPGGVAMDLPEEFMPAVKKFVAEMPRYIEDYETLLAENEIILTRAKGIGVLSREQAINASTSGPVLRGSGVNWDLRRADPYSIYDRFDFDVITHQAGDAHARYRVRLDEMKQSVRILEQAIVQVPQGPYRTPTPKLLRPPIGEAYGRLEAPKGELGFYLVSDNSINPFRCKIRAPSYINITVLRDISIGAKVADLIITLGSIDIVLGEVDR